MKKLSSPFELIKKSLDLFFEKENFLYFLKVYMWLVPFEAFFLFQNYFVSVQSKVLNVTDNYLVLAKYPWFFTAVILVNIGYLVASVLISIAGVKAVQGVTTGKTLPTKEIFEYARKKFWLFAALTIILSLIELGGIILLVIPGIVFAVWYSFAKFIMIIEGKGIKASLKASKSLVTGRFWKVFGRIIVFTLFSILIQIFFSLVPYGMGPILSRLFEALIVLPLFLLYKELLSVS